MQIATGDTTSYDLIVEIDVDPRSNRFNRDKKGLLSLTLVNPRCIAVKGWVEDNNANYFLDFALYTDEIAHENFLMSRDYHASFGNTQVATAIYGGKHFSTLTASELPAHIADLAINAARVLANKQNAETTN